MKEDLNVSDWINLWDRELPKNFLVESLFESITETNKITNTGVPQLKVWFPNKSKFKGSGVLIFPGGNYTELNYEVEGAKCAKWCSEKGILAAVVKYRVGLNLLGFPLYPYPVLDTRRAIRIMRSVADDWSLKTDKIGVMGFGSGGHLASICATSWKLPFEEETRDRVDDLSCRPDFAAMIYPIISLEKDWTEGIAKTQLIGKFPNSSLEHKLSSNRYITVDTPPCFLAHSNNDKQISARHSLAFATGCHDKGVPAACYIFEKGGHGYGIRGTEDSNFLPELLQRWFISLDLI